MASALTVLLLGCWLAGRSGVSVEGSYPKPSISVSPGGVIPVGRNVTIWCRHEQLGMRILLYKDGEPSYPKPSISLSPSGGVSLGGTMAVWCRRQHQGVQFMLNKERCHFPPVDSDESEVAFRISNVHRVDGGSYSCFYQSRSEPFAVSDPSDPVELVVRDPSLPRPSISLSPTGVTASGADVTIRCQVPRCEVRFFLHKAGDLNPQQHMDPTCDGAEFHIPTVGRQHGGSYSCSYRLLSEPFISSQPSDPVQLVAAGGTDPTQSETAPTSPCPCSVGPDTESKGSESPSITPKTEGTTSAGPKQPNPPTTEPDGKGRTDSTQLGTTPASTYPGRERPSTTTGRWESSSNQPWKQPHPGSTTNWAAFLSTVTTKPPLWGTGRSERKLSIPIIAGVSALAVGLLLLLMAFIRYRRTRGRKGPAPKQSRESEPATTVYALRGEGTQLDVLLQEPDPGAKGLTYAELDGQALQAKQGGPAPAPEPVLYAAIDVS